MGFNDVFGGTAIYPSFATYIELTLTEDVELSWPIEQQIGGDQIVADIIDLISSIAALSIIMPDARNATQGFTTLFNNVGAQNVTIKNHLGGTIATVVPGSAWQIYLTDNSTEDGTWQSFQYGASISVANAAALVGNGLINIGLTLSLNLAVTSQSATPLTLDANSRARIYDWTSGVGAVSIPDAATLGDGWFAILRNSGSGNWVVTPTAGTIDGGASVTIAPGGSLIVVSDGTNYITLFSSTGGSSSGFNLLSVDVAGAGDYTISGAQLDQIGYLLTGVLSGNRNIIVPGTVSQYWVDNETSGAFTLTVKTAAGTGIVVTQGARNILYCDGTNVVSAESASISFPVAVVQGGTGSTTAAGARTNLSVPPNSRTITAGTGLSGGGDLSADRTFTLDTSAVVPPTRTITAGLGLTGGGDLSANIAFAVSMLGIQNLADPNADRLMFWDDSAGFTAWLTLGTNLSITGTTINAAGIATPVSIANGGTGQASIAAARLAMGILSCSQDGSGVQFGTNTGFSNFVRVSTGRYTLQTTGHIFITTPAVFATAQGTAKTAQVFSVSSLGGGDYGFDIRTYDGTGTLVDSDHCVMVVGT